MKLGLDRPMFIQYFDWLGHVATGDLGRSLINRVNVSEEIRNRVPITFHLGVLAFILSILSVSPWE